VYSPTSASQTKIANDLNELFVQLPLGASNVMDLMKDKRALRTDLKVVGSVALPEGTKIAASDFLGPECKSATHVISAVYVGGFAMAAGDGQEITKTNLFDLASPRDGMTREGYSQICQRADAEGIELGGCSVPLRLALLPFDTTTPPIEVTARKPFTPTETAGTQPGVFDQNAIERIVRDRHGIVKRKCWDLAGSSIRRVDVTVIATISLQGKVTKAEPQLVDSEGAPDLAATVSRCVAQEGEAGSFPQPDRERSVNLPFHLIRQ